MVPNLSFYRIAKHLQQSKKSLDSARKSLIFSSKFVFLVSASSLDSLLCYAPTHKDQVLHGKPLSNLVLRGHFRSLEKEFAGVYKDLGFPESNLGHFLSGLELFQEDKVQLWWAGKELKKEKTLLDYIGKNEKTKIMILLQSLLTNSSGNLTIAGDAPA